MFVAGFRLSAFNSILSITTSSLCRLFTSICASWITSIPVNEALSCQRSGAGTLAPNFLFGPWLIALATGSGYT